MKRRKVHSLIDKVYSRKNLELAWEKVKQTRGSAGIDEVTIERFEQHKADYLDRLHRKLSEGSCRPKPVKRVAEARRRPAQARHTLPTRPGVPASAGATDGADL